MNGSTTPDLLECLKTTIHISKQPLPTRIFGDAIKATLSFNIPRVTGLGVFEVGCACGLGLYSETETEVLQHWNPTTIPRTLRGHAFILHL